MLKSHKGAIASVSMIAIAIAIILVFVASRSGDERSAVGAQGKATSTVSATVPGESSSQQVTAVATPTTVPAPQSFDGVGAQISPASPSDQPSISADEALDALQRSDLKKTLLSDTSPSRILLVHYENVFGEQNGEGKSDTPSVPNQLVWLAEFTGQNAPNVAPSSPSSNQEPTAQHHFVCTYYIAVSATTDDVLDSFDECS